MGLDITAYRKLTKLDVVFNADEEPIDPTTHEEIGDYVRFYVNHHFPGREQGIEHRAIYSYEGAESVMSRGYGGYNRWREQLAKLAGYPLTEYVNSFGQKEQAHAAACWEGATGPFSELINFADNEGVIGPVVAAKLAQDFADFEERAAAVGDGDYFYSGYQDMKRGCEMAADGGALDFH